jgi:hypothetical protein
MNILCTLTLLERFKCEFETENNKRNNWGMLFNSLEVEGRTRVPGLGL